jgi:hypothetical protein
VLSIAVYPLALILSLLSQTTRAIERSFFQEEPVLLYSLLSSRGHIDVSLPEPISFSDQMSREQAFFFFRRLSRTFSSFEFYSDTELPLLAQEKSVIFKARWSFRNKTTNNQHVLQVFFYLVPEKGTPADRSYLWRIAEIKAEKL